jgi:hypothetical protein
MYDLEKLSEMEKAATPGEWSDYSYGIYTPDGGHGTPWDLFEHVDTNESDSPFIAALRNAAPELLSDLEKLTAQLAEARATLAFYADKKNWTSEVYLQGSPVDLDAGHQAQCFLGYCYASETDGGEG